MTTKKISRACVGLALLTAATLCSADSFADVVVVVSAKSPVSSLTPLQIAKIFLGKLANFPGDGVAVPLDQAEGSAIKNEFYARVAGKDSAQLNAYWAKIIFAGDGQPPTVLAGDAAVKRAIASNPQAIGYIDESAVDNTVRVLLKL